MRSTWFAGRFAGWAETQPRRALFTLSVVVFGLGVALYWNTYAAVVPHDRSEPVWLLAFLAVLILPVLGAVLGVVAGRRRLENAVLFGAVWFALSALAVKLLWYVLLIVVVLAWAGDS
jgi:hypothetical protein